MDDYKQIEFSPLYYINKNGDSVLKECDPTYYIIIEDKMYHRKHSYGKTEKELDEGTFCIKNNRIYRKMKIYKNKSGYSIVTLGRKHLYIHRLVYMTFVGDIPPNKEINHIDHNKDNNSLGNLELLTHSENQIKSAKFYGKRLAPRCKCCGKKMYNGAISVYCSMCRKREDIAINYTDTSRVLLRKVDWPDKETLIALILTMSFTVIGIKYGVSDNAVRHWCKYYNLPFRKKDIELRRAELEIIHKNSVVLSEG